MNTTIKNNWSIEEINEIYNSPLLELIYNAATLHREYNDTAEVQVCTLLSIKTGGCSEDCAYCPQAARYNTGVDVQALMKKEEVLEYAQKANNAAATNCNTSFAHIIECLQPVIISSCSDDFAVMFFACIKVMIVRIQTCSC